MTTEQFTISRRPGWSWMAEIKVEMECDPTTPRPVKLGLAVKIAVASRAILTGADLTGADLMGADLAGAVLTGAVLTRADLTGADLTDANLTRANLTRANLTGADLTGANLRGADLAGAVLTSSGTMSMHCALAGIPGAVVYRANPLTYAMGRILVSVPFLGIANLLLDRAMYPEYLQGDARPERLAAELDSCMDDPDRRARTLADAERLREVLGRPEAGSVSDWIARQIAG